MSTEEEGGVINEHGDRATLYVLPKEFPFFVLAVQPHPNVRDVMVRVWQKPTYITMSWKDDCVGCAWKDGQSSWIHPRDIDQFDCPLLPDQHLDDDTPVLYKRWFLG